MQRLFNPVGELIIEDVDLWMDGGTVTFVVHDAVSNQFEIEFVQRVNLKRLPSSPCPGSLLINRREVEIRSELESDVITALKNSRWGNKISPKEKASLMEILRDCIAFISSKEYLEVARKIGRIT